MGAYTLVYSKHAVRDIPKLKSVHLSEKARILCESLIHNPIPDFSKSLLGDLGGCRSIRLNIKHRVVYKIHEDIKTIYILRMWGHYDDN